ncbi:MAG TPA: lyase family protein, partial [Acidobacteriota bacterium]|nr:lyase family protein [Acidobacteriota bacterium]
MIPRYTTPEMARIWSEERKFDSWLQVELAVCRVLGRRGMIPAEAVAAIEAKAAFSIPRIQEIEAVTHHDVIAFTTAVAEQVGEHSRFFHYGLTSTDVVDTAQALVLREAVAAIRTETDALAAALKTMAFRHKTLPVIGR